MSYSPMSFTTATAGRAGFVRLGSGIGGQSDGSITASASSVGAATSGQTFYLGTTQIAINRSSGAITLTGITSIDGTANATSSSITFNTSGGAASGTTFNGSTARTIDYSTVGAAAAGQTFYIGTTQVAINRTSGALTLNGVTVPNADNLLAAAGSSGITNPQLKCIYDSGISRFKLYVADGPTNNDIVAADYANTAGSAGYASSAGVASSASSADQALNSRFTLQRVVPAGPNTAVTANAGTSVLNTDYVGWAGNLTMPPSPADGQVFMVTSYYTCTLQGLSAPGTNIVNVSGVNFGGTLGALSWVFQNATSSWLRLK